MKKTFSTITIFAFSLILGGCAAVQYHNPDVTEAQAKKDFAVCRFEAEKSTASYGPGYRSYSASDAIAQGIGQGLEVGMRNNRIATLCMESKGYSVLASGAVPQAPRSLAKTVTENAAVPAVELKAAQQDQYAARPTLASNEAKPTPSTIGESSYTVEKLARQGGCTPTQSALISKTISIETYQVACAGGQQHLFKCESRQCRMMNRGCAMTNKNTVTDLQYDISQDGQEITIKHVTADGNITGVMVPAHSYENFIDALIGAGIRASRLRSANPVDIQAFPPTKFSAARCTAVALAQGQQNSEIFLVLRLHGLDVSVSLDKAQLKNLAQNSEAILSTLDADQTKLH